MLISKLEYTLLSKIPNRIKSDDLYKIKISSYYDNKQQIGQTANKLATSKYIAYDNDIVSITSKGILAKNYYYLSISNNEIESIKQNLKAKQETLLKMSDSVSLKAKKDIKKNSSLIDNKITELDKTQEKMALKLNDINSELSIINNLEYIKTIDNKINKINIIIEN